MESPYSRNVIGIKYPNGDLSLERDIFQSTSSPNDIVHTLMDGEDLLSIAYRYLGDSGLWGIIGDYNNIIDPLSPDELFEGREIVIPSI